MTENKPLLPCCRGRLVQPYAGSEGYKNWSGRQELNIILNSLFNILYFINSVSIYRNLYRIS